MRRVRVAVVAASLIMTTACLEAPVAPPQPEAKPAAVVPAKSAEVAKPAAPAAPTKPAAKAVKWSAPIDWVDYEAGLAEAKKSGKPLFLLVYADWCPKCRALGPKLADPELVELSKSFVMVKQSQVAKPKWLERYASYGGYVPRILFLNADGSVREDINSGHPKYPYFFAAQQIPQLRDAMRAALPKSP